MWLLFSLLAAAGFGVRGILYQWSSRKPIDRNLMLFGVYVSGALVALLCAWLSGSAWTAANLVGILMGLFSFVSNAAMYRGFAVGKASLVAIMTGLTPVVVVLGGYILYGEVLNIGQSLSFIVILIGLILLRVSKELQLRKLDAAIVWGAIAMLMFGANDLAGKGAMILLADVYPTLFGMFATGSVCFFLFWRLGARAPVFLEQPSPQLWSRPRTFAWGMLVGLTNISGMIFILLAFRDGIAGLVSAITAANVLLIIGYARLVLKERFTTLEIVGMSLTFAGIALLRLLE